jgi:pilus assembly protein CpaE
MAQLNGLIVSDDQDFVIAVARRLRSGAVSVRPIDEHAAQSTPPDVVIVDLRTAQAVAMPAIEKLRGRWPQAGIFAIANAVDADLVIQSMRAGANEFFAWPPAAETFDEALRRTAARRAAAPSSTQPTTMVFFGAKGGAGTTTLAVNCAVEIARLKKRPTLIVDLKAASVK